MAFYHDFRREPAGRHVLKLCRAEACQAAGGDALAARAEAKLGITLGHTTADARVTLEPMIEIATLKGRVAFGPVTVAHARSVLDAMAADGAHALRLGVVDEIPWLKRQIRLTFARCGVIDPRSALAHVLVSPRQVRRAAAAAKPTRINT